MSEKREGEREGREREREGREREREREREGEGEGREEGEYPGGVPPEWQVSIRRTLKEDGRYLIYYDFVPSPQAQEVELERPREAAERRR